MRFTPPIAPLLLIGGTPDGIIPVDLLTRFVQLAGGEQARIAVITSGSRVPLVIGPRYARFFAPLCADAQVYHLLSRADANSPEKLVGLEQATGIFFSGGEQLLFTTRLSATLAFDIIKQRQGTGAVFSGTSAGSSVMSATMIAFGEEGLAPRHAALTLAPGFGFLPQIVIDQHFSQRQRMGRLTTAVLYNPEQIGVGIDESTAVLITSDARLQVLGAASVTLIDGSHITETDSADVEPLDQTLTVTGLRVYTLTSGESFDLENRRLVSRQ